jgi:hypothetical protein
MQRYRRQPGNQGVFTYNMSVLGGVIAGLATVALHNRFYTQQLPTAAPYWPLLPIIWPIHAMPLPMVGQIIASSTPISGSFTYNMSVLGGVIAGLATVALHNRFYTQQLPTAIRNAVADGRPDHCQQHSNQRQTDHGDDWHKASPAGLDQTTAMMTSAEYIEMLGVFTYNMSVLGGVIAGADGRPDHCQQHSNQRQTDHGDDWHKASPAEETDRNISRCWVSSPTT